MFFLIRSAFWLSVVFASLPPATGQRDLGHQGLGDTVVRNGLAVIGVAKDAALNGAKAWCVEKPARCLADAARLSALVEANRADDTPADVSPGGTFPVPVADPRRHGAAHAPVLTRGR